MSISEQGTLQRYDRKTGNMVSKVLTLCYWPIYIWEHEGEEEVAMAHLKAELWLVRCLQNKHGGRN